MTGFLLIDKSDGPTSHDVVSRVRRLTGEKRVGHAGTLDPFATGLLIVGVGRVATREFHRFVGLDKEYEAVFALGGTSDTDDRTGKIEVGGEWGVVSGERIEAEMKKLTGPIEQIPPAYSAIKIGGKKMYEAAREGKPLEAKARAVTIYSFDLLDNHPQPLLEKKGGSTVTVRIRCSTGTYVRSLARDLGAALGTGGYALELRRTAVGPFRIDEATALADLTPENVISALIPIETALSRLPSSVTIKR